MSKKTFYQYFSKKEELIDATIQYIQIQHLEKYRKFVRDKNAIEVFLFTIKEIKKSVETESFMFWHDLQKYYPALYQKYDAIKGEQIQFGFENNIRQGIAEGYYREDIDVELLSFFHSVQMKNTFEIMMQSQKKFSVKRLTDFFIDVIIHQIANEKGLKFLEENYLEKNISTNKLKKV
jgi:AcrR family transcriptional regulator